MTRVTRAVRPSAATGRRSTTSPVVAVLQAAHIGPALTVTAVAGLLAVSAGLAPARATLVVAAVLTGQLSIGWSNDLVDVRRDRASGRTDKPLVSGAVPERVVRLLCTAAVVATVPLSLALGLAAGLVQLVCTAAGWAYNLGLKATWWSWLPYAVAFGGLPVVVWLAGSPPTLPPPALPLAGALLGTGAHLLNVLPDLADDAATGVRGLPHRLGARWAPPVAIGLLAAASVVAATAVARPWLAGAGLVVVAGLTVLALTGRGRTPFRAAMLVAVVDVVMLVVAG